MFERFEKFGFALTAAAALNLNACAGQDKKIQSQMADAANKVLAPESVFTPPVTVDSKNEAEECLEKPSQVKIFPGTQKPSSADKELTQPDNSSYLNVFIGCEKGLTHKTTWATCSEASNPTWEGGNKEKPVTAITCGKLSILNGGGEPPLDLEKVRIERKAD